MDAMPQPAGRPNCRSASRFGFTDADALLAGSHAIGSIYSLSVSVGISFRAQLPLATKRHRRPVSAGLSLRRRIIAIIYLKSQGGRNPRERGTFRLERLSGNAMSVSVWDSHTLETNSSCTLNYLCLLPFFRSTFSWHGSMSWRRGQRATGRRTWRWGGIAGQLYVS